MASTQREVVRDAHVFGFDHPSALPARLEIAPAENCKRGVELLPFRVPAVSVELNEEVAEQRAQQYLLVRRLKY